MENSCDNQTYNVGDLVWVLRRNGMWWPAQVIKPSYELHEGSSRSGKLPVKLLGREPSENLGCYEMEEVKPFRSEEFNSWIELAATLPSACKPSAARDFAIREALEIERIHQLSDERTLSDATNTKNEERGPNDSCSNQDYEENNKRQRRRRADDLLGVGIEVRTSTRNRKMLPQAREFLDNIRNKRRRASKKHKGSDDHHSHSNKESKNKALILDEQENSSPGCASQKAAESVTHEETLNDQNEADDDYSSDSDDNGTDQMRSRAAEIPWDWIRRKRRNFIMPTRRSSQACVPVKSAFIRLMKDFD